jgi:hypothetical protein
VSPPIPRAARLRQATHSRRGFVALACILYLAAGLSATWPEVQHLRTSFLAGGAPGYGEAAPGDHLQTAYRLWLVGEQLEGGRAPWRDPYSFRPEASPRINFAGWPFGLPYWPLEAAFGSVVAWNLFVLLGYLVAGGLACAWLRELDLPRGPALAGGLAFALAPYRVAQSAGHLLGPISMLLPLALWSFERGRRRSPWWFLLAATALASIPLSGQVHLALGAVPFFGLYALCRTRGRPALVAAGLAVALAVGAAVLVQQTAIEGSIEAGGRSLSEVSFYSADGLDFVTRHERHGSESFVFLGWAIPVLAAAGLTVLLLRRRWLLALILAVGAVVPILLAFGTNLPLYETLYRHVPGFEYPRVPERLLPIAALALAALVAFTLGRGRRPLVAALAVALLFLDLHVDVYGTSAADEGNRAYAALMRPGRLLELPVFLPDRHYGSVYLYYAMQAKRERPAGYSTLATQEADRLMRRLRPLNCGAAGWQLLDRLGVRYVALHAGLYRGVPIVRADCVAPVRVALSQHGFRVLARDGAVTMFERR